MGSIQHIYSPEKWKIILEGKSKIIDDDYIYQMVIGYCDGDLSSGEICVFISKQNYESLLNGTYSVEKFPYSIQKIILFDKENNVIPLVKGRCDEEYTESQKEYVKKLKRSNI